MGNGTNRSEASAIGIYARTGPYRENTDLGRIEKVRELETYLGVDIRSGPSHDP
jgi:hypothetical protein